MNRNTRITTLLSRVNESYDWRVLIKCSYGTIVDSHTQPNYNFRFLYICACAFHLIVLYNLLPPPSSPKKGLSFSDWRKAFQDPNYDPCAHSRQPSSEEHLQCAHTKREH